jgi:pimeloyl-ACP methyl ester carboxylesterase
MAKTKRLFKSFFGLFFPVVMLVVLALGAASLWFVHVVSQPKSASYLVTPEKYGQLSTRGAKITDETWTNHDGTSARGWLLKGMEGAPAVILLHRYGADRSHVLDLGVKISESTNFTILMPDVRGHGADPLVKNSSFGGFETEDAMASIEYLRSLKTDKQENLVGESVGFYGVEIGAFAALKAASQDKNIKALVIDSVPSSSDQILASAIQKRFPFAISVTSSIASYGTYLYFYDSSYNHEATCSLAKTVEGRQVLLLAGTDVPELQESTNKLNLCFADGTSVESKLDFNPSGYNLTNASIEQLNIYDQKVIEFFSKALR